MLIEVFLFLAGSVAGFIDSIAGGGGLVTVPILMILLGPDSGTTAVGTNKLVAIVAAGAALLVYMRGGHVTIKGNRRFAICAVIGAFCGAFASPHVPPAAYKWIIVAVAPFILWLVFQRDWWVKKSLEHPEPISKNAKTIIWIAGFVIGFYDGIAGPGGGTMMFLVLLVLARLPLLQAMGTMKVANLSTASIALGVYAYTGHVAWTKGLIMAVGIGGGAVIGASLAASQGRAAIYARGALVAVVTILIIRLALI